MYRSPSGSEQVPRSADHEAPIVVLPPRVVVHVHGHREDDREEDARVALLSAATIKDTNE